MDSPAKMRWHHHAANSCLGSVTPTAFAGSRRDPASPTLTPKPGLGAGISSGGKKGPEAPPATALAPDLTLKVLHEGCQPQHPWVLAEPLAPGVEAQGSPQPAERIPSTGASSEQCREGRWSGVT